MATHLEEAGWTVVARNWTGSGGELDLVVVSAGRLRFVEVKARSGSGLVGGLEAVTPAKQRRLVRAARAFLQSHDEPFDEACFLVASVEDGVVELVDNAFDA